MQVRAFERYIALKHIFLSILRKARSIVKTQSRVTNVLYYKRTYITKVPI